MAEAPPTPKVLLVDDEEAVVEALAMTLRRAREFRVQIEKATSANEAQKKIDAMKPEQFALVIADYRMPGANGVELLARIRAECPSTVRVLLTGYSDIDIAMEALEKAGVHFYLQKPWDNEKLRATVGDALRGGWK
jgi:DNA-binding NtrC family response regulator